MKGKRTEIIVTVLLILIVIFGCFNLVRFFIRFDLTENKVYTISDVSKNLFTEIPDRVNISYFRSEKLKDVSSIPLQIEDMLQEYTAFSRRKIVVHISDPAESGDEQYIQSVGLQPQQIEVVEKNERSLARIYSGIIIEYLDKKSIIPFVVQPETLEYDLTTRIRNLISERERRIGIILGDENKIFENNFSMLDETLREGFTAEVIPAGDPIPEDLSAVTVIGHKDIKAEDFKPIKAFIDSGGNICFLAESVYIDLEANLKPVPLEESPVLEYVQTLGVEIQPGLVLDDYNKDFSIPRQMFGGIAWQVIGKYPQWIAVLKQNVSQENPVTSRFTGLDLLWASPVQVTEREGIETEKLIQSSGFSWLMEKDFNTNPYQAAMFEMSRTETEGQYTLGVACKNTDTGSRVVVISDSDFVSNVLQYSNSSYNLFFFSNLLEWLSNDEDMLDIKTRAVRDTRLTKIENLDGRRRVYIFAIVINIVIIPILIVIFGLRRYFLRRRKMVHGEK